jgi:hypothetical protein
VIVASEAWRKPKRSRAENPAQKMH